MYNELPAVHATPCMHGPLAVSRLSPLRDDQHPARSCSTVCCLILHTQQETTGRQTSTTDRQEHIYRTRISLLVLVCVYRSCPGTIDAPRTYGKRATPSAARRLSPSRRLEPAAGRPLATDGRAAMPTKINKDEVFTRQSTGTVS